MCRASAHMSDTGQGARHIRQIGRRDITLGMGTHKTSGYTALWHGSCNMGIVLRRSFHVQSVRPSQLHVKTGARDVDGLPHPDCDGISAPLRRPGQRLSAPSCRVATSSNERNSVKFAPLGDEHTTPPGVPRSAQKTSLWARDNKGKHPGGVSQIVPLLRGPCL